MSLSPVVRPAALREGDCIGLAAPASGFKKEELYVGVRVLQDLGFCVRYTPRVFEQYRYLAGSDAARAAELHALFADPTIQAIFCCRGGYGSQRLLPYLDTAVIKAHHRKRVHVSRREVVACDLQGGGARRSSSLEDAKERVLGSQQGLLRRSHCPGHPPGVSCRRSRPNDSGVTYSVYESSEIFSVKLSRAGCNQAILTQCPHILSCCQQERHFISANLS